MNVAIIPARKGSKRLPGKNKGIFCGKPLIYWTIQQALESHCIDEVYVSSNDLNILDMAKEWGCVAVHRPHALCRDDNSTESAIFHCCYSEPNFSRSDNIILLQPTCPLRMGGDISAAYFQYQSGGYDSLLSVSDMGSRFQWWENYSKDPIPSYPIHARPRSQDHNQNLFIENGSIYIFSTNKFIDEYNRLFGQIGIYKMKPWQVYDIDTLADFELCEYLMEYKCQII